MRATISSIFYYGDTEESKNEKYSNIFYSLNKISNTIDDTEEMINEIEESIKNPMTIWQVIQNGITTMPRCIYF